ncbi:unnamed protein product [Closterium sp. NIES-53]
MRFVRDFEATWALPESLTTAVTVLLHKKGEKDLLTNYRPITLLTTVYKVLAKVLANRLKQELHHVISKEQHGFIPGRSLAGAVALVADAIEAADNNGEDWYLLLVDFQKASDTISRPFLFKMLEKLGLPGQFVKWTAGLHKGSGTRLAINGWLGERVEMQRGVRQGCPLAPYLFLCALEPLCAEIRKRGLGIKAEGGEAVSYVGYADDTSLILNGEAQLQAAAGALDWFGELSGLHINRDKSIIMPLGRNKGRTTLPGVTFKWAETGFYPPPEELWERIRKTCDNYVSKGEATAEKIFVLWSGELARLPKKEGGLGLVDPKERIDSLAIRQVGKFLTEQDVTKRWLSEKAAALPQGVATFFAHKTAGRHWGRGSKRWKAIAEVFWESPFAELPAPSNGWEAEREMLCFNRKIMFKGGSPFGNRQGAAGIRKTRLGDLLITRGDGSREVKSVKELTTDFGSMASGRWARKAYEAIPVEWKAMLTVQRSAGAVVAAANVVRTFLAQAQNDSKRGESARRDGRAESEAVPDIVGRRQYEAGCTESD